jgi:hypothetical protein
MPRLNPIKWRDLVRRFRALGFEGSHDKGTRFHTVSRAK